MIVELVTRVFSARDAAQKEHWAAKTYAQHMALGAFYVDVIEAVDAFIENYQGMVGRIKLDDFDTARYDDIGRYLQDEADWLEANRDEICQGISSLGNLIDNLTSVYTKTVYLLSLK